jgi:hypothetical protein
VIGVTLEIPTSRLNDFESVFGRRSVESKRRRLPDRPVTECQQIHLVNPATGEVLGEEDELESPEFRIETAASLN